MPTATTRAAIPYPLEADYNDIPVAMRDLAQRVDDVFALSYQGLISARPTTVPQREFYWASDDRGGKLYYGDGSQWWEMGPAPWSGPNPGSQTAILQAPGIMGSADPVAVLRGKSGQTGDLTRWQDPTGATTLAAVRSDGGIMSAAAVTASSAAITNGITAASATLSGAVSAGSATVSGGATITGALSAGSMILGAPLPVGSGGTGSATQNFVDLTTAQTVAGIKTHSADLRDTADVYAQYGTANQVRMGIVGGGAAAGVEFNTSSNFIGTTASNVVAVNAGGTTVTRHYSNGELAVGTTQAGGTYRLNVMGGVGSNPPLYIRSASGSTSDGNYQMNLSHTADTIGGWLIGHEGVNNGKLKFAWEAGAGPTDKLTLSTAGVLANPTANSGFAIGGGLFGFGTSAPSDLFQVYSGSGVRVMNLGGNGIMTVTGLAVSPGQPNTGGIQLDASGAFRTIYVPGSGALANSVVFTQSVGANPTPYFDFWKSDGSPTNPAIRFDIGAANSGVPFGGGTAAIGATGPIAATDGGRAVQGPGTTPGAYKFKDNDSHYWEGDGAGAWVYRNAQGTGSATHRFYGGTGGLERFRIMEDTGAGQTAMATHWGAASFSQISYGTALGAAANGVPTGGKILYIP